MKQIKTIICRMNQTAEFDAEVNAAIKNGWELTRREPVPTGQTIDGVHYSSAVLLAELEVDISCENCANGDGFGEKCFLCDVKDEEDCQNWITNEWESK